tara:strand:- start:1404 stop:1991 length:588 start_codon:yes stop_codon:yes gene_type:complete
MLRAVLPLLRRWRFGVSPAIAVSSLAESWIGTTEKGQNQGAEVEHWIKLGGGSPQKAPPWCAYFVSAICETVERVGLPVEYVKSGRAVAHWQLSNNSQRIDRDKIDSVKDVRGLVFVRTRMSRSAKDRARAILGERVQGHTGFVLRREGNDLVCVAGNSTGEGHASRTGGVALERLTKGSPAWDRVVGFVRVAAP